MADFPGDFTDEMEGTAERIAETLVRFSPDMQERILFRVEEMLAFGNVRKDVGDNDG